MARKTSGNSDTVIAFPGASRCPENSVAAEIVGLARGLFDPRPSRRA